MSNQPTPSLSSKQSSETFVDDTSSTYSSDEGDYWVRARSWTIKPAASSPSMWTAIRRRFTRSKQVYAAGIEIYSSRRVYSCPHMSRGDEAMCSHWRSTVVEITRSGERRFKRKAAACGCFREVKEGLLDRVEGFWSRLCGREDEKAIVYPSNERRAIF